jgi:hypothetical protein
MHTTNEINPVVAPDQLPLLQAVQGVPGSKDGKGIGDLVDADTMEQWIRDYIAAGVPPGDRVMQGLAFQFGVVVEGRCVARSFVEAEAELRSEWASQKGRPAWDTVREAVWAGFDRARDRRV